MTLSTFAFLGSHDIQQCNTWNNYECMKKILMCYIIQNHDFPSNILFNDCILYYKILFKVSYIQTHTHAQKEVTILRNIK